MTKQLLTSLCGSALLSITLSTPTMASETRRFEVFLDDKPTGELEAIRVSAKGSDRVEIGNRKVAASRYALSTDELDIEVWYNDQLGWVGLASDAGKGRRLTYRRM